MFEDACPFQYPYDIEPMDSHVKRTLAWGMGGSASIAVVFYLVQALGMQNWTAPFYFMTDKWYFVLPLMIGFGVQAGLFRAIRDRSTRGSPALVASGGVSTTSMAACCVHNLVPLVPVLGVTGIAAFFSEYQSHMFLASTLFMAVGVIYMLRTYRKIHACCEKRLET